MTLWSGDVRSSRRGLVSKRFTGAGGRGLQGLGTVARAAGDAALSVSPAVCCMTCVDASCFLLCRDVWEVSHSHS